MMQVRFCEIIIGSKNKRTAGLGEEDNWFDRVIFRLTEIDVLPETTQDEHGNLYHQGQMVHILGFSTAYNYFFSYLILQHLNQIYQMTDAGLIATNPTKSASTTPEPQQQSSTSARAFFASTPLSMPTFSTPVCLFI